MQSTQTGGLAGRERTAAKKKDAPIHWKEIEPSYWPQAIVQRLGSDIAVRLGHKSGLSLQESIAIIERQLGAKVLEDHDDALTDCLRIEGPDQIKIYLNPFASSQRNRFTLAHELGHFVLHSNLGKLHPVRVQRGSGGGREEWEANWFAAGFLMPEEEFRRVAQTKTRAQMALHFNVSESAVEMRARALKVSMRCSSLGT